MALFFTALFLVVFFQRQSTASAIDNDLRRIDCYPESASQGGQAVNQGLCEARGCVWKEATVDSVSTWSVFCHVQLIPL